MSLSPPKQDWEPKAAMEGERELTQDATPEGEEAVREEAITDQSGSAVPASPEPQRLAGAPNPSFTEDPPPYSPPDPKMAHLLYGPSIFYQPPELASQPNSFPGSFPLRSSRSHFIDIPLEVDQMEPPPKDYMVESLMVMAFCCLVTGIFALVYSKEACMAATQGDFTRASVFSKKARTFMLYSLVLGLCAYTCWVIYVVVYLYL